jgi:hypothetical protein
MTILKTYTKKDITVYIVQKTYDDEHMQNKLNTFINPLDIELIIDKNTDVYTEQGALLLRFRKNALSEQNTNIFYDNVINFAKHVTSNRGSASGSKIKLVLFNPRIMTNIFGYFDRWSPSQKIMFKKLNMKPEIDVRECRFNQGYPEKYKNTLPFIQEIDDLYKKLTPSHYAAQKKKADETYFKISHTSFTTVTTNVNFQTSIHTDTGDDNDGFGNLTVIQRGNYSGGETCLPQYGIGVDVRCGDILFMDVHEPHGNLPINLHTPDTIRLSIVCYLRKNVWLRTLDKTKEFFDNHKQICDKMRADVKILSRENRRNSRPINNG